MTKEITKANILQEIQDKLALRELVPEKFTFSENVVPTYNIENHLLKSETGGITKSITGTGGIVFYTVPAIQRWFVNGYTVVFLTGTYTVSGVYISRKASPAQFLYWDLTAAQSVSYAKLLQPPFLLESGDTIGINIDGHTVTGNLRLYIDYMGETIR